MKHLLLISLSLIIPTRGYASAPAPASSAALDLKEATAQQASRTATISHATHLPPKFATTINEYATTWAEQIAQLIQEYKTLMTVLHERVGTLAAEQTRRQPAIQASLLANTPLSRELTNIVAEYEASDPLDYDRLLIDAVTPLQAQMNTLLTKLEPEVITPMLRKNSKEFGIFRDLMGRGPLRAQWPLNEVELKRWQRDGLVSRPAMIRRVRLICDDCSTEILSQIHYLRGDYRRGTSYMDPADHHNYNRAHSEAVAKLQKQSLQTEDALRDNSAMPDPVSDNENFLRYVLRRLDMKTRMLTASIQPLAPGQSPAIKAAAGPWIVPPTPHTTPLAATVVPAPLDEQTKQLVEIAKAWLNFHTAYSALYGWSFVAIFIENPEAYREHPPVTYQDLMTRLGIE